MATVAPRYRCSESSPPPRTLNHHHSQERAGQPAFIRHPGGQYPKQGRKRMSSVLEMYKEQTRDPRAWPLKGSSKDSQKGKKMSGSHTAPQKHPSGTPSLSPGLRTRLFPLRPHTSSVPDLTLRFPPKRVWYPLGHLGPHLVRE